VTQGWEQRIAGIVVFIETEIALGRLAAAGGNGKLAYCAEAQQGSAEL
jgi:hypothetical protein